MPFDLSDAPPIVLSTLRALDEVRRSLRKKSDGGRRITPAEQREIGARLRALGETLLREAAD